MKSSIKFAFCTLTILIQLGCGGGKIDPITNADPDAIRTQPVVAARETDWPWWAGPTGDFVSKSQSIPTEFGESKNLVWKTAIPGEGHASPIVVGDKVFLALAENNKSMSLACFSRGEGSELWKTELHSGSFMRSHQKNSQASSTPACDGDSVFTAFMIDNGIQVSSVSIDGKINWQKTAGSFQTRHGYGTSPIIYKSIVIVAGDNQGSGFIAAFDRPTGDLVWRVSRKNAPSYATPAVLSLNGKDHLVISGIDQVIGYDPATGDELWSSEGPAPTTANTVISDGTLVFAGGGYPDHQFFAINPSSSEIVWKDKIKNYVPSPILIGEQIAVPQDGGIMTCYLKLDGTEFWKLRIGQDLSGSPVRVGKRLFLGGEKGTMFVIDVSGKGKILAKNKLDSRIMTTPAICGDQIFVRTASSLYCFAELNPVSKPGKQ